MNHCEGCSKQFPKFSPVRDGLCGLCDKLQQAFEKGDEAEIASVKKLSKQCLHCGLVFRWNDELLKGIPCGKCSTTPTQAGATKTEQSGDAVRSHAAQGRRGPQHSQAEAYESKPVPAQARRMPSASISRSISRTISGSGRIDEPFEVADSSDHEVIELDFDSDVDEGVKAKSGKIVHGVMQDVQRIRKEVSQFRLKPAPDSEDTGVHNTRNFQKLRNDANQRSLTQKKVMVTMIKSEPVLLWRNGKRDNPGLPAVGHAAFGNTKTVDEALNDIMRQHNVPGSEWMKKFGVPLARENVVFSFKSQNLAIDPEWMDRPVVRFFEHFREPEGFWIPQKDIKTRTISLTMGVPVSIAKPGFDREEDDQSDDDSSVKARKRRSRGKKRKSRSPSSSPVRHVKRERHDLDLEEQKPRTEEDIKVVVKQEAANEPVPAIKRASRPRPKASVRSSSLRVKLVLNRDMIFARREFRCLDNDSSASCNVLIDFNPRLLKAKIDCNSVPSKLYPYTYKMVVTEGSSGIPALLARRPPTFDEGNLCTDGARQLAVAHTELARSRWLDFYLLAFLDAIMDREIVTPVKKATTPEVFIAVEYSSDTVNNLGVAKPDVPVLHAWLCHPFIDVTAIQLPDGISSVNDFVVALSHWIYKTSRGEKVFVDFKVIFSGKHEEITLLSPISHMVSESSGYGDLGLDGLNKFRNDHQCSPICLALELDFP